MAKLEFDFFLIDLIEKYYYNIKNKSLYKEKFDKKDPININKATKMLNKRNLASIYKNLEMPDIKYITLENKHNISTQLKSGIQFTQSRLKLIKFDNGKKQQVEEQVVTRTNIVYIVDILV